MASRNGKKAPLLHPQVDTWAFTKPLLMIMKMMKIEYPRIFPRIEPQTSSMFWSR
jgi:hypothetical protein